MRGQPLGGKAGEGALRATGRLFKDKNVNAELPEEQTLGTLIATIAIGQFADIRDDIAHFLAREDVSAEMTAHWEDQDHISVEAFNYKRYAAPNVSEVFN